MAVHDHSDPKQRRLGPLETRLLGVLCRRHDATVREMLDAGEVDAAYTTVMTTLDRLYKKGLLHRSPDPNGRAFRYRLRQTAREFYRTIAGAGLNRLLDLAADPSLPVSCLVDAVVEHDAALLDELGRAISRKRRELRRRETP